MNRLAQFACDTSRNCKIKAARDGIYITMRYASSGLSVGDAIPLVREIDIRDSSFAQLTQQPIFIEGWSAAAQVSDITIANCLFENAAQPDVTVTNAVRISLLNDRGVTFK